MTINESIAQAKEFLEKDEKETKAGIIEPVKKEEKVLEPVNDEVHVAAVDGLKKNAEAAKKVVEDSSITKNAEELMKKQDKELHESKDVRTRLELAKLISEARQKKQTYKISKSLKEGFRYNFEITGTKEPLAEEAVEIKTVPTIDGGEILNISDEEEPIDSEVETVEVEDEPEDADIKTTKEPEECPLCDFFKHRFDIEPSHETKGVVDKVTFTLKKDPGDKGKEQSFELPVNEDDLELLTPFFDSIDDENTDLPESLDKDKNEVPEKEKDGRFTVIHVGKNQRAPKDKSNPSLDEGWDELLNKVNRGKIHRVNPDDVKIKKNAKKAEKEIHDLDTAEIKFKDDFEHVLKNIESYTADILSIAENKLKNYSKYESMLDTDVDPEIKETIYSKIFITKNDLMDMAKKYSGNNNLPYSPSNPRSIFTNNAKNNYNPYQLPMSKGYQEALDKVIELYKGKGIEAGIDSMRKLKSDFKALDMKKEKQIRDDDFDFSGIRDDDFDLDFRSINEDLDEHEKCVICGAEIEGYGNNAEPVKHGVCCDECNQTVVIPARLEKMKHKPIEEDVDDDIDDEVEMDMDELPEEEVFMSEEEPIDADDEFFDDSEDEPETVENTEDEEHVESKWAHFEPSEEAAPFWNAVKEAGKLDDLEFFLDEFDISTDEELADYLSNEENRDFLFVALNLNEDDSEDADEEPEPLDYDDLEDKEEEPEEKPHKDEKKKDSSLKESKRKRKKPWFFSVAGCTRLETDEEDEDWEDMIEAFDTEEEAIKYVDNGGDGKHYKYRVNVICDNEWDEDQLYNELGYSDSELIYDPDKIWDIKE